MTLHRETFSAWIGLYEHVWRTAGTESVAELFSDDATYLMGPFERACVGLPAIRELWERERQGHDEEFAMSSQIIAVEGDTGVARVDVSYMRGPVRRYLDIWIVEFALDGRCNRFEEWPFTDPATE